MWIYFVYSFTSSFLPMSVKIVGMPLFESVMTVNITSNADILNVFIQFAWTRADLA
jgi:hypothetical protein